MNQGLPIEILLVEDSSTDLELTLRALKKANLANRIETVRDGEEALDFLFARNRYRERSLDDPGQAEVSVGELFPCQADPGLLRQVFTNLLSNAFKYSRHRTPPKVEVSSHRDEQGKAVYTVRDNGTGFDMAYYSKLFGVFQRLHRQEEFEGTGVGLAIVQRIVSRHGGRIWANAAPDQGATFSFTLD